MMRPRPQGTRRRWPRLPRRTARLRLTALYGGLFLACGTVLLAVTYLLVETTGNPTGSGSQPPGQLVNTPAGQSFAAGQRLQLTGGISAGQLHQIQAAQKAEAIRVVNAVLGELLIRSPVALAIVTVVALVLGWVVAGRILRPLATITAAARRISASNLNERLSLHGPDDELKALGDTLDGLFARLEASFQAQRHFVANASHELRTPLTRERTMLQVALDDPGTTSETWRATTREVLASNAEQESLIEALLTLASSEGGLGQSEPVDLAAVTGAVLLARRPEIGRLGLRIEAATEPAVLDGDPLLTERLVANLIDNAIRHNVAGGHIEIGTGTKDGRAVLSVASTGPVIPAAEVGRLFQPFQRLNGRRAHHGDGHGLGLSIVRAIATAHGAAIGARALPGGGLTVDVTFPPTSDTRTASGCPPRTRPDRAGQAARLPAPHEPGFHSAPGCGRVCGRAPWPASCRPGSVCGRGPRRTATGVGRGSVRSTPLLRASGDVGSAADEADRSALPIAGDDETAKETVIAFLDAVGYAA